MDKAQSSISVKGFFRIQIEEDGKIIGDSGFLPNQITNMGFQSIVNLIGAGANSKQATHLSLGSGGMPAAGDVSLAGEVSARQAVVFADIASKTARFTAVFASSNSFMAGAANISNIGLFANLSAASLLAGNTFASSSCNTNQNVNVTYELRFS